MLFVRRVWTNKMHLRLCGTRTHADRSVTADGLVRLQLDISAYQLRRSSPETRKVVIATLRVNRHKI